MLRHFHALSLIPCINCWVGMHLVKKVKYPLNLQCLEAFWHLVCALGHWRNWHQAHFKEGRSKLHDHANMAKDHERQSQWKAWNKRHISQCQTLSMRFAGKTAEKCLSDYSQLNRRTEWSWSYLPLLLLHQATRRPRKLKSDHAFCLSLVYITDKDDSWRF
jgi:hypothetical protein